LKKLKDFLLTNFKTMEDLFLGTVESFNKQRGVGQIKPDDKSNFGNKVSCHWKSIKSSDKWPTLVKGMRVAFLAEEDKKKANCWKTTEVYSDDGNEIKIEEKVSLLNKGKLYKGACKSFNKSKGTGMIKPDGKGPWNKSAVQVRRSDIEVESGTPFLKQGQRVQFQLTKEKAGYRALNVTILGAKKAGAKKAAAKSTSGKKPQKKAAAKSAPRKKPQKKGKKAVEPKVQKKVARKRKRSQERKSEKPPAKKSRKTVVKKSTTGTQLESGVYGGMEVDVDDVIEIGILLKSHWVGSLIGKKGVTINAIKKLSNASMQFGDNEIEVQGGLYKVFAISGTMNQVADAAKEVAIRLGEASESLEYKIVFLVPWSFCGMFVGKKGATINEIRGDMDQRVRIDLSKDPVYLSSSNMASLCTVFGPRENMKHAIERTVAVLAGISNRIRKQMSGGDQWGENNRNGGYRGNDRGAGGWSSNRGRGSYGRGRGGRQGRGRGRGKGRGGRGGGSRGGRGRGSRRGRGSSSRGRGRGRGRGRNARRGNRR